MMADKMDKLESEIAAQIDATNAGAVAGGAGQPRAERPPPFPSFMHRTPKAVARDEERTRPDVGVGQVPATDRPASGLEAERPIMRSLRTALLEEKQKNMDAWDAIIRAVDVFNRVRDQEKERLDRIIGRALHE
jgi:hypothetical protein